MSGWWVLHTGADLFCLMISWFPEVLLSEEVVVSKSISIASVAVIVLGCSIRAGLAQENGNVVQVATSRPICTIYQNRDYGGSHWVLRNGDDMKMVNSPEYGTSDGIHRFIYQPSWNDQVSSFKVTRGCTLTLWENVNLGGHYFRSNKSYTYVGSRWNDKASEAICECAGLPNY
jgi:syncollin